VGGVQSESVRALHAVHNRPGPCCSWSCRYDGLAGAEGQCRSRATLTYPWSRRHLLRGPAARFAVGYASRPPCHHRLVTTAGLGDVDCGGSEAFRLVHEPRRPVGSVERLAGPLEERPHFSHGHGHTHHVAHRFETGPNLRAGGPSPTLWGAGVVQPVVQEEPATGRFRACPAEVRGPPSSENGCRLCQHTATRIPPRPASHAGGHWFESRCDH
jgi:hypothetical protein